MSSYHSCYYCCSSAPKISECIPYPVGYALAERASASSFLTHILLTLSLQKATGNDAFKSGQWAAADKAYTECLEIDPNDEYPLFNAKLFANR